jgi:hypothetical protein
MWQDLPKNYTTFGATPEGPTVGFSCSAQGLALRGVEGLLFGRRSGLPLLSKATNSNGFSRRSSS